MSKNIRKIYQYIYFNNICTYFFQLEQYNSYKYVISTSFYIKNLLYASIKKILHIVAVDNIFYAKAQVADVILFCSASIFLYCRSRKYELIHVLCEISSAGH